MTDHARRWLVDFPDGDLEKSLVPTAVSSVAAAALAADRQEAAESPEVRLRTRHGTWVTLHGSVLRGEAGRQAAVIVEPAHPERIVPLLMNAYGLTEREQDVTRLVLAGLPTSAIAEQLVVVPATVQQHLKSIFEKTGVRTRRDLTTQIFFRHYEPRLRDNETRAVCGLAVRGGPAMPKMEDIAPPSSAPR
ncbi:MAG TPA: helix-turn-helix transcriptional regulator [Nocardioidaceae bacterium]|nr:helix-turn-helix transcriptional regulator [Nocardioidaceae bacterium]